MKQYNQTAPIIRPKETLRCFDHDGSIGAFSGNDALVIVNTVHYCVVCSKLAKRLDNSTIDYGNALLRIRKAKQYEFFSLTNNKGGANRALE